jgi:hypothetical protein
MGKEGHMIHARRLLAREQVSDQLQLSPEHVDWLVSTGQLTKLVIAGEVRFDSKQVEQLIDTYAAVAARRDRHAEVL